MLQILFMRYWIGIILILFFTTSVAEVDIPKFSHRVTDLTATLSVEQASALESRLAAFETKNGSQIAVIIVPSTQPEDIARFGIRVAEAWKIGRKNVDDGVILIVAKEDRKLRLEVGYGLEGAIPDAIAKLIIAATITPLFKEGDFAGGIDAGVTRLMQLIEGETLPAPAKIQSTWMDYVAFFMFILFSGVIAGFILSAIMGRVMGGMLVGLGSCALTALVLGLGIAAVLIGLMVFFIVSVLQGGGVGGVLGGGGISGVFGGNGYGKTSGGSRGSGGDGTSDGLWSDDYGGTSGGSEGGGGGSFGGGGDSGSW